MVEVLPIGLKEEMRTVIVQAGERINRTGSAGLHREGRCGAAVDDSDVRLSGPASGAIVSTLVLSTAAVLFGLATFVLGQWVAAGTTEPRLVDTADCRVIAMTSAESLSSSSCDEQTDSSILVAGEAAHAQDPPPTLRPSQVMPAAGLRIHTFLQSLG